VVDRRCKVGIAGQEISRNVSSGLRFPTVTVTLQTCEQFPLTFTKGSHRDQLPPNR
jgi:hypothetical protein